MEKLGGGIIGRGKVERYDNWVKEMELDEGL